MQKFLVLYCMPNDGMREWMKKPEAERKAEEDAMKAEWDSWMKAHAGAVTETAGAGKTKRVTSAGSMDSANDVMLFSLVEAASQDEATKLFENHPHLKIPGSWIDVMPANYLP